MKIFQRVYKNVAIFGFEPHQKLMNMRHLLPMCLFGMGTVSCCVHLFREVKTFQEYAESIFITISYITATTNFMYIVFVIRKLFDCFYDTQNIINGSEFS